MLLTRRHVMRLGSFSPFAIALGVLSAPSASAASRSRFDRGTWNPMLGSTFSMTSPVGRTSVVLVAIEDLAGAPRGDRHRFSLDFRAASRPLADGAVSFSRRGFASVTLFVAAVDRGVSGTHYQAVVNRPL